MYALLSQPLCACVIKGVVRIADSKLSHHLSILKEQDFISGRQQGNWIICQITIRAARRLSVLNTRKQPEQNAVCDRISCDGAFKACFFDFANLNYINKLSI